MANPETHRGDEAWLIALVGPTGSGKSHLAMNLANHLEVEIVNCDSMQVHRGLNIGTAKPSPEWRRRIPHHLFDVIAPDQYYSAGRYMADARRLCRDIANRARVPVVVGGTGLYLRALLQGVFEGPGRSRDLRARLERMAARRGWPFLHRLLTRVDAEAATRIQAADRIRVIRALEVYFAAGEPISRLQTRQQPLVGFSVLKVGLTMARQRLYDRIDRRVESMFQEGLIEEVRQLLQKGYSPDCKGFEALGYRHVSAHLQGQLELRAAIERTQQDTRRYAKRQMTWFRRDPEIHWLHGAGDESGVLEQSLQVLAQAGGPPPSSRETEQPL